MGTPIFSTVFDHAKVSQLRNIRRYSMAIKVIGVLTIVTSPFWLGALFFTSPRDYSYTSSLICVPILALVGAVAVAHFAQSDWYLRRLLMAGLVGHMAASSVFLWVGWFVYGGAADAFHYWTVGLQLAEDFHVVGWSAFRPPYWSTNLINNICGIASLLIGDALPTLFITFALISLTAGYLYYRAFTIAFPDGDRWLFGLLVVLSPSLLFWSSYVGKDSLIQYFIALTCFGFAKVTQRDSYRGLLLCAIGLSGAMLVRAHVAAMLAIGLTFPYAVGRSRDGGTNKAAKIILIPLLLGGTYYFISQAQSFLGLNNQNSKDISQEAETVTKNSQIGGSAFNEGTPLPIRVAESPFLMFRPFPWEMKNSLALASAVESVGWLLICCFRRREIWSTLRRWRDPYVGFLLMYAVVFSIAFGGAISNFGILLRQRIMMTPLVLMLVCASQKLPTRRVPQRLQRDSEFPLPVGASR